MPDKRAQAFSISKFYQVFLVPAGQRPCQALGGAVLMFSSPHLSIVHYCLLLFISLAFSTGCFVIVANRTRQMEKNNVKFSLEDEKQQPH